MSEALALRVRGLCAGYAAADVLSEATLEVPTGGCVALIGANGAGKSTLLKSVSGLLRPRRGSVRLFGDDITDATPDARLRLGLAHCPEGRRVFASMSVADNLLVGAHVCPDVRVRQRRLEAAFARFPKLHERRRQVAGTLSGGEQQMLALARSLMAAPRVLLLDEPSLGLAPRIVAEVFAHLAQLQREGVSLLLVEQNAALALSLSSFAHVLEHGRVVLSGPSAALQQDVRVRRAYLGG